MIVVRNASRSRPREMWVQEALGVEDSYGNPFRIIELRWRGNALHRMAEYGKTRGFEDTEIRLDEFGELQVTHVNKGRGCIQWMRSSNGIGPFRGQLAETPYNLQKLAAMYGNRLFSYADPMVEATVKGMWEKRYADMTPEAREWTDKHNAGMQTRHVQQDSIALQPTEDSTRDEAREVRDMKRDLQLRQAELARRERELEERTRSVAGSVGAAARDGVTSVRYSKDALDGMKMFEVRRIAKREFSIAFSSEATKDSIIEEIMAKQSGGGEDIGDRLAAPEQPIESVVD